MAVSSSNNWGGPRANSGPKQRPVKHQIILRDTDPYRYQALEEQGELTPIAVMQSNMEFFHRRAAQVMAVILAMPVGQDVEAEQHQALKDFAGVMRCREMSEMCARDLAKYIHAPMAPKPAVEKAKDNKALEHIPTPKAVSDAFALAAAGLPPEPRKRL